MKRRLISAIMSALMIFCNNSVYALADENDFIEFSNYEADDFEDESMIYEADDFGNVSMGYDVDDFGGTSIGYEVENFENEEFFEEYEFTDEKQEVYTESSEEIKNEQFPENLESEIVIEFETDDSKYKEEEYRAEAASTSYYSGNFKYYISSDGTVGISDYNGKDTELIIPGKIDGKVVTRIEDYAFDNCLMTSIQLPNSIVYIGYQAFQSCSKLKKLKIPGSVRSFGHRAFRACTSLTSVEISSGITRIEQETFSGCSSLTSIKIPKSVTEIGPYAFQNCINLKTIEIPEGITDIQSSAFYNCSSLTGIKIPDSVTSIGPAAFQGCSSLTSIKIPDSVKHLDSLVISGCYGLTMIELPGYCFDRFRSLYEVSETKTYSPITVKVTNVTTIHARAFINCGIIQKIELPDNLENLEIGAFQQCIGLTSIQIPSTVTSIGAQVFSGCIGLKSIQIPKSVTELGTHAFSSCTGLTSIQIPDSVTKIGVHAFQGCTGLKSIQIPKSITEIGDQTFNGCTGLTSIAIPNSVTKIGDYAFQGCTGLTSIQIPDSVTKIGTYVFEKCTGLKSIEIPNSVIDIGSYAVANCSGLKSIKISSREIGNLMFINCTKLTSVEITSTVKYIGAQAFRNCTGLTSIELPNGVEYIYGGAFLGCSGLKNIKIANTVILIGDQAFDSCTSLSSIEIPSSVTHFGRMMFNNCVFTTLYWGAGLLIDLKLPDTVRYVYYPRNNKSWHVSYDLTKEIQKFRSAPDAIYIPYDPLPPAKSFTVSLPNKKYEYQDDKPICPEPIVKYGDTVLSPNQYTVTYVNNKSIGTATVTVTGDENHPGSGSVTFEIIEKALTAKEITDVFKYTGAPICPTTDVFYFDEKLSASHYTVSYKDNVEAGTATLIIKGDKEHSGEVKITFEIVKVSHLELAKKVSTSEGKDQFIILKYKMDEELIKNLTKDKKTESEKLKAKKAKIMQEVGTLIFSTSDSSKAKVLQYIPKYAENYESAEIALLTASYNAGAAEITVTDSDKCKEVCKVTIGGGSASSGTKVSCKYLDWATKFYANSATKDVIEYLKKDENYLSTTFVARMDASIGDKIFKGLTNCIGYRGWDGWLDVFSQSTSVEEAEKILVSLLETNQVKFEMLAKAKTSKKYADMIVDAFRDFMGTSNMNKAVDSAMINSMKSYLENSKNIESLSGQIEILIYEGKYDQLYTPINQILDLPGMSSIGTQDREVWNELIKSFEKSSALADKLKKYSSVAGKTLKYAGYATDMLNLYFQMDALLEADEMYCDMLLYVAQNAEYAVLKQAAANVRFIISNRIEAIIKEVVEEASKYIGDKALSAAVKTACAKCPYMVIIKAGYSWGTTLSNTFFMTGKTQELKDSLRIQACLGSCLSKWMTQNLSVYNSSSGDEKNNAARKLYYSMYMLWQTRKNAEETLQNYLNLFWDVKWASGWKANYNTSKTISNTLNIFSIDKDVFSDTTIKKMLAVTVACPVNAVIYNKSGKAVLKIADGTATSGISGGIYYESYYLNGDYVKMAFFNKDAGYTMKLEGNDSGTVDYTICNVGADNQVTYQAGYNIPVEKNATVNINSLSEKGASYTITDPQGTTSEVKKTHALSSKLIPVTSIQLNSEKVKNGILVLNKGEKEFLKAAIVPENSSHQIIAWTSDHENIVTVKDGLVSGINTGEAVITATIDNVSATYRVIVHNFSEYVSDGNATCTKDGTKTAVCSDCGIKDTIVDKGSALGHEKIITTKAVKATLFASGTTEGSYCKRCKTVLSKASVIPKLNSKITLVGKTLKMQYGQTLNANKLIKTMTKGDKLVSCKSSNTTYIKVSKSNVLTAAKKAGSAKITLTFKSGKTVSITIKVQKAVVATIAISVPQTSYTLKVNQTVTIGAKVTPITSGEKITYSTSDKKVATVSSKGVIKAVKKGTVTIKVKSGKISKSIKVVVK